MVNFTAISYNLWQNIFLVILVHFFQFWNVMPRKIWQPWFCDALSKVVGLEQLASKLLPRKLFI
jgi:hypothetical protein